MRFFDSHCHVHDERLSGLLPDVLMRARGANIERLLCCGTSENDWDAVSILAREYESIVPAFGLHPGELTERSSQWYDRLRGFLLSHPQAAVGEIGLDHSFDHIPFDLQEEVLIAQLKLAKELQRPVSVHCRRAWDRLTAIVTHVGLPRRGGVLHSYSGSAELVPSLEALGFSISFSGTLTYDNNRRGIRSCTAVSVQRLMIETDTPELTPVGAPTNPSAERGAQRGRAGLNEPANLPLVATAVARARSAKVEEIAELTWENAVRLFCPE